MPLHEATFQAFWGQQTFYRRHPLVKLSLIVLLYTLYCMKNFVGLLLGFWLGMGSLLAQPIVNLGADTTVCANAYVLQAGNAGATFLWNTGATTASITASSSGLYWVEVTNGTGTTRDSINLTLAPPPVLTALPADTGLCQGVQQLAVQSNSGVVQWLDSFNQVLAAGDTINYTVMDTSLLWYQASNFIPLPTTFGLSLSNAGTGFTSSIPRGIIFNVNEYLRLDRVQMEVDNGPFSATIEIRDGQNNLLYSIPITFPSVGQHTAVLGVELPVGSNYSMTLQNMTGGRARFNNPVNNWNSLGLAPYIDLVEGVTFAPVYAYFYDWQISVLDPACSSDLDSILINSLTTPIVDLGQDTTLCGDSLLLNVFNTGAIYTWNTGASSSSIFASASGLYQVTVSQGGLCSIEDSILITVLQQPIFTNRPTAQDACQGSVQLVAQVDTGVVQWLDSTGQILALGDTLNYHLIDTTQIWYQASYFSPVASTAGLSLNNAGTGFTTATPRGIVFNVNDYLRLNRVQMEVDNGPFSATIEIRDGQNNLLYSIPIAFPSAGQHTAVLEVDLLIGTNYSMTLQNIAGGQARFNNPVNNWNALGIPPYLDLVGGVTFSAVYAYFYDWEISILDPTCSSNLDSVVINSLETPVVDLGRDTVLCGSSILLDATNPGATYTWNTGVSSPAIFANSTGWYSVTVTQGGLCTAVDSVLVEVLQQPNLTNTPMDQDACQGELILTATTDAGILQWLDSTGKTIALGDTLQYDLVDTTRIWYQASFLQPLSNTFGLSLNSAGTGFTAAEPRGIIFNVTEFVRLNRVQMEVDNGPFSANIEIRDGQNKLLYSVPVFFLSAGQHTAVLEVDLPIGSNYSITLQNIIGGQARFNNPVSNWSNIGAPPYIDFVAGVTFSNVYAYFYDWQISLIDPFCSSELDSVLINSLATPTVALGGDTTLCSDSLLLDVTNPNGGYSWNTGQNTATITASTTGWYVVTVTQNGFCPVSDSIQVTINTQPQLTLTPVNQSACREIVPLVVEANRGLVQWLDSSQQVFAVGDTLLYDLQDTTLLYYRAGYLDTLPSFGLSLNSGGTGFTAAEPRGIVFNVNEFLRLNRVQMEVDNGPFSATIEIRNGQSNLLYSIPVNFPSAGQYAVALEVDLPVGMGYSMRLSNIVGGQARFDNPVTNWNSLGLAPYIDLVGGVTFSPVYAYFYDWEIAVLEDFCISEVDSVLLSLLPTPTIDLPADTLVCSDSVLLDVSFPNATYLWTPNSVTTGQVVLNQEGNYAVTSTVGSCSVSDSIVVYLTPVPNPVVLSADTTTCVATIERRATGADIIKWYDAPSGGQQIGVGNVFAYPAQATDTLWVTGQNFANKIYTQGLTDTFVAAQSNYFFPNQIRGLLFEAHEDILLEEVTMYIDRTALIGTIALWDEFDQVIDSQAIILTNRGANVVPLNFKIPRGADYKLVLLRYNTVDILSEFPFDNNFPLQGDQVTIVSGVPFAGVYQYFYNWKVKTLSCTSAPLPSIVNVLPTPTINFPVDTIVCGDSLVLDASAIGATTYNWSTGATGPSITADSSMQVSLTASIGSCSDEDSINIFVVEPPSLILPPNDTILCEGNATFRASGNASYYAWYDSLSSTTPFALGDSIRINLTDSVTLWVEGIGFLPQSEPVGAVYEPNAATNIWGEPQNSPFPTRGMSFRVENPILLNTVEVYVDTFTTATLTLYKTGFPYYNKVITLPNNGQNTVSIDTLLEPGDYRIELSNKSAGRILFSSPYSNSKLQQLNTPNITFLGSTPIPFQYYYFYNWKISTPSCATSRLPFRVNVPTSPVLTMVADTATCTTSSLVLDPVAINNPNYSYNWSNNSSGDTLQVNSSGYYGVTVTNNGQCSSSQNTFVQFLSTPTGINIANQSICAPETLDLAAPVNAGIVVWYDSSSLNEVVYLGEPYQQFIANNSTFWLDVAPKATTRIGAQAYNNPNETAAYLNFIIANTFDVHAYSILDSVAVYVEDAPANLVWEIMDSLGNMLYTGSQTITTAREKVFLPINALLAPSEHYQLSFSSISTAFLVDRNPIRTPSSSAAIASLTGTVFAGVEYTSFFDWHFSYAYPTCHAPVDSFEVLVQLPVTLPDSIYSCDSAVVDISNANASSYQWSIGATTGQVTLTQAGQYTVTVSDGAACTVVDTVVLEQPVPVGLPTIGAICGNELSTNYLGTTASYQWNTGDTTPTIVVPGPNIYAVTITTQAGCQVVDSVYIAQLIPAPMPQLGGNRILCFTDTLDAGMGGQGMSYLWNTGAITQRIPVTQSGLYRVTVTHPLGCSGSDAAFITLDSLPTASFTVTKSGTTVLMNNTSTNIGPTTTFKWYMGDGTQYSIPNPFHSYNDTGCYEILLVVYGSCGNDSTLQTIGLGRPDSSCTVSIRQLANAELFQIVPNPNTGSFELWLEQPLEKAAFLNIYNSQGILVATRALEKIGQQQQAISLEELPTGLYFLHWQNGVYQQVQQLIIQRP